jgi:hypothetical protein
MLPLRAIAAAALLAFALAFAPVRAMSAPALWVIQSGKAKVYLFGSIHVLKDGVDWKTPALDDALAKSDDLWLEVPSDPNDVAAVLPQLQSLGMDPAHPLSTKISKADLDALDAKIKAAGLPGEAAFEPFRPWLAGLMIEILPAIKAGYTPTNGVETTLRAIATKAAKPIEGFETVSEQLHLFSDLNSTQELAFLHASLASKDAENDAAAIDKLETEWQSGDVEKVATSESQFEAVDPSFAALLITDRNARWAKKLDDRLHGTGTSFVAVGMMHLAGKGSLIDDLTKLGYTVTRVQ